MNGGSLPELIKQDLAKREKHLRAVLAGPAIPTETSELSCAIELANTLQRLARWLSIDAEDSAYLELGKKALAASHSEGNVTAKSMESLLALLGRSTSSESLSFDAYLAAILDCASRYAGLIRKSAFHLILDGYADAAGLSRVEIRREHHNEVGCSSNGRRL